MTADQPLALWPGEEDVELPLDEATAKHVEDYAIDVANRTIRDALAECLSWAEGRSTPNAERVRYWRTLVGRPAVVDDPGTPEARRDEGIARAAAKWTDEEAALVDKAIATVAAQVAHDARTRKVGDGREEFTTVDVWAELNGTVPITKGIAGRMLAAKAAGIIANTGRTVIAPRESTGPNHGQRLTVWRAV